MLLHTKNKSIVGLILKIRWVSVVEFDDQALSIGKVFGQESTVVKWNYQILSLHLVTVCQKVPILDFQSEFSMSKIIPIFLKKIFIEEYQFKHTFFVKIFFCWLQFQNHFITKMTPNFWQTVTGNPKFGNFIWLQLEKKPCFLGPIQLVRWRVNIHYYTASLLTYHMHLKLLSFPFPGPLDVLK